MKMIEQQQDQYKFEEFDQHINLFNIVSAGNGKSITLLRNIAEASLSDYFDKKPSILIVGEDASNLAVAFGNTILADDIRQCDARCFMSTKELIYFYGESKFDTIHIITNIEKMSNDNIVWNFLKHRVYRFSLSYDGQLSEYVHLNGHLILTANDVKKVSQSIIDTVGFKVVLEHYTQEQLEMIVRQRLRFCSIDFGNDNEVITTILEYACGGIARIIEILRICVLLVQQEGKNCLTLDIVQKAVNLAYLPPDP